METNVLSEEQMQILMGLRGAAEANTLAGVYPDIPNEVYHDKRCPGIQGTGLKQMLLGPHAFKWWLDHDNVPTQAQEKGIRKHKGILEGPEFLKQFVPLPVGTKLNVRAGMAVKAQLEADNPGKTIIKGEEYASIGAMIESIWRHPAAADFLTGNHMVEVSAWAVHPKFNVLCKVRPDFYNIEKRCLVSLKTAAATFKDDPVSPQAFTQTAANKKYHMSEAFYFDIFSMAILQSKSDLPRPEQVYWIAIQNNESGPFPVNVFNMSDAFFNIGREDYERALEQIVNCAHNKDWGHQNREVITLDPPKYLIPEEWKEGF